MPAVRRTTISLTFDKRQVQAIVATLGAAAAPPTPVLRGFADALVERTRSTIRVGGLPTSWKPLARNTVAAKRTSRIGSLAWGRKVRALVSNTAAGGSIQLMVPGEAYRLHTGTRPHVIRPRHGKLLAFRVAEDQSTFLKRQRTQRASRRAGKQVKVESRARSKLVFARKVNHPGTPPRPLLVVTEGFLEMAWRQPLRAFRAGKAK